MEGRVRQCGFEVGGEVGEGGGGGYAGGGMVVSWWVGHLTDGPCLFRALYGEGVTLSRTWWRKLRLGKRSGLGVGKLSTRLLWVYFSFKLVRKTLFVMTYI